MPGRGLWPRAFRCAATLLAVVFGLIGLAGSAASAENPERIDASIARSHIVNANPNNITIDITIKNTGTGKAPTTRYGVFVNARQGEGESILEEPENCQQVIDNDPTVPPGVYRCSIIVNNPGLWTFVGYVNLPGETGQQQLKVVETKVDITDAVTLAGEFKGLRYVVEGSTFEVFLLQLHVAVAMLWLLLGALMAVVAVPYLRRVSSGAALQWLEVRRSFLASALWVSFGSTVLTGTWLLSTQTAYEAPFSISNFSVSDYEAITRLPYAAFYLNALYLKIVIFLIMAAASIVLSGEASRRAQAAEDSAGGDDDFDIWSSGVQFGEMVHVVHSGSDPPRGRTHTSAHPPPVAVQTSERTLWLCVAVLVGGSGLIGICVTVLKYCHELIETANAARILGG